MSQTGGPEPLHALRFHSHAYFDCAVPERVEQARAFRELIRREFAANARLEVRAFHAAPAGPHPLGSFEVLFAHQAFADYVCWLMFARPQGISILVHPLTGWQVLDHTTRALWLGEPLPLDRRMLGEEDARRLASGAQPRLSSTRSTITPDRPR
jgi:aromatic ring-cleaving dioxygenase